MQVALPTEITSQSAELCLQNPQFALQQKLDGKRILVCINDHSVIAFSRNGETNIPRWLEIELSKLEGEWVYDGELVGKIYWLFDILTCNGRDVTHLPWLERQQLLNVTELRGVRTAAFVYGENLEAKKTFFNFAQQKRAEGVVFKDVTKPYTPGRSRAFLKHKFIKTVDCVVVGEGFEDKNNFILAVYKDGKEIECGRVSALTGDGPRVKVGDVVEVKCLYVSNDFNLVQPTMPRIRTDKKPEQCTFDQLEVLQTNKTAIEGM